MTKYLALLLVVGCATVTPHSNTYAESGRLHPNVMKTLLGSAINVSGSAPGTASGFISTGTFTGGASTGKGNFSCPNNPASSSPCLINPNNPLEIGGACQGGNCNNGSAGVYIGVLGGKTAGPIVAVLNHYGNLGGTENTTWETDWNGDTQQAGDLYLLGGSPHIFSTLNTLILRAGAGGSNTPAVLVAPNVTQTSGNLQEWYANPAGSPVATVDFAGKFTGLAGTSTTLYPMTSTAFVDTTARQPATCAGNVDIANPYSLPANALSATGKGVRFHFMGTAANNANAKTIRVMWGSQVILSKQLTVSLATENWEIEGECYKSGSSTQQCFASAKNFGGTTVSSTDGATVLYQAATLSGTQTDTSAISLRVQEVTCTANTDITQTLARVSFDN